MKIHKNERSYDNRKKYVLNELTSLYNYLEEKPNNVKHSIGIHSSDEPDKTNFKFIESEVINERVTSFIFRNETNIDILNIGFFGLSESEMNKLDEAFQKDNLFLSASRGSKNFNIYLQTLCDLELSPIQTANPMELYDKILYPSDEDIEFEDIFYFFGDFYFLTLNLSLVDCTKLENEISRISSYVFIKSNILISLPFNEHILSSLLELTKELIHINYYHLLEGIVSPTWGDSFFKFYKIIESLYPIYYYRKLYSDIKPASNNIVYLSYLLEKNVKVKPNEEDSIKNAFEFYKGSNELPPELFKIFNVSNSSYSSLATHMYRLRNSYVHGRWIFDPKNLEIISDIGEVSFEEANKKTDTAHIYKNITKKDWQLIVTEMLKMIIFFLNDAIENDFIEKVLAIEAK